MDRKRKGIIDLFENGNTPGEILRLLNFHKSQCKFVYITKLEVSETSYDLEGPVQ